MPDYSQEQITQKADARLVDKISFSAKVALLKQQANAPQGDERCDFKTAVYLCACLNNFSFEDALTSNNSSILSFMLSTFYQGFRGESAPIKSIADYMAVLQELIDEGALEHLGPGLGFICPEFKIEATGKIAARYMLNNYGTELHFVDGVYDSLVFSKYVLIPGDEVKVVINGLTNIASVVEIINMRTLLIGEQGTKHPFKNKGFTASYKRILVREKGFESTSLDFTQDSIPFGPDDLLLLEIVKRNSYSNLTVRIREVLQASGSLQTYIIRAILEHNIPNTWPEEITANLDKIPTKVVESDLAKRVDLRKLPLITIDGDDAKDFDDAVYCRKQGSNFHLYVAIADVSYYVRNNTVLDKEAMNRCNSVYFPYYVIPMLPVELSNGICSLNPNVDRLCMVCDMVINKHGKIEKYQFYPAVMNSHARLTYNEAYHMIKTGHALNPEHEKCVYWVSVLYDLYKALRNAREARGAFEFEGTEVNYLFDEHWNVINLEPYVRNEAHMLIEECMIAANICAASFVGQHQLDTLYRVHARPTVAKLEKLRAILSRYGIDLPGQDEPSPQDFKQVAQQVAKLSEGVRNVIGLQLLRSMSKASYHPTNIGHFGLALENYAHFTSPIRRYPDLQLHRVIKFILERERGAKWGDIGSMAYTNDKLLALGLSCTNHEISADDAEFDVDNSLKCEYVKNFINTIVPATVSTITNNTIFVTLNDFYIDGKLEGSIFIDGDNQCFKYMGKTIHIGDQIFVRIMNVRPEMRHIELGITNLKAEIEDVEEIKRKLQKRPALPADNAYNNSYKDELFERIADFSGGKKPESNALIVRQLADFGLERKLTPVESVKKSNKKPNKMSQQLAEIKEQLLGASQPSINTQQTEFIEPKSLTQQDDSQVNAKLVNTIAQASSELRLSDSDIASFGERPSVAPKDEVVPTIVKVKRKGQKTDKTILNGQTTTEYVLPLDKNIVENSRLAAQASAQALGVTSVQTIEQVDTQNVKQKAQPKTKVKQKEANLPQVAKEQTHEPVKLAELVATLAEDAPTFVNAPVGGNSSEFTKTTDEKIEVQVASVDVKPAKAKTAKSAKTKAESAKTTKSKTATKSKAETTQTTKVKSTASQVTEVKDEVVESKPTKAKTAKSVNTKVESAKTTEVKTKVKTEVKDEAVESKTANTTKSKTATKSVKAKVETKVEAVESKSAKTTKAKSTDTQVTEVNDESVESKPTKAKTTKSAKVTALTEVEAKVKADTVADKAVKSKTTKSTKVKAETKVEAVETKSAKTTKAKLTATQVTEAKDEFVDSKPAKTTRSKATSKSTKTKAESAKTTKAKSTDTQVTEAKDEVESKPIKAKTTKSAKVTALTEVEAKVKADTVANKAVKSKTTKSMKVKAETKVEAVDSKTAKTTKSKTATKSKPETALTTKAKSKVTQVTEAKDEIVESKPTKTTKSVKATSESAKLIEVKAKAKTEVKDEAVDSKPAKTTKSKTATKSKPETAQTTKVKSKVTQVTEAKDEIVESKPTKAKTTKSTKAKGESAKTTELNAIVEAEVKVEATEVKPVKATRAKTTRSIKTKVDDDQSSATKVEVDESKIIKTKPATKSKTASKATKTTKSKA